MPAVKSIDKTADGFRIVRTNGSILTLSSADVPSTVKSKTTADVETWINQWLAGQGWFAQCRVRTITPLNVDLIISDKALSPQTSNWFGP